MRTRRSTTPLVLMAVAVGLAACGDSTGIESPDDQMAADAAILAADATLEELAMFREPIGFHGLRIPGIDELPEHQRRPGHPGGPGSFQDELAGTRAVSFYDVGGVQQAAYDAAATASVHLIHDVEGSIQRDRFSAEISRERDMVVTGLEGEETHRTWNGSGSSSMLRSGVMEDGTARSHSAEGSFTFLDVVVPIPGSDDRWPISGTISRTMAMTRTGPDGSVSRDVEIEISFDGTSTATAVVNGEAMEIDLSARQGQHPVRHRPRG